MSRVRSNRVVFTLNNYDEADEISILHILEGTDTVQYAIVGQEIGANGTPHLQGFISINHDPKECGIKFWKKFCNFENRAHFENAKGSDKQNYDYCSKEGPFIEVGERGAQAGETIASRVHALIKEGKLRDAMDVDPEFTYKHANNMVTAWRTFSGTPDFTADKLLVLRPWQELAVRRLLAQKSRSILFVVDPKGCSGKTVLGKHLLANYKCWASQGKFD